MIATVSYAHPRTGQRAEVVVYHVPGMRRIVTSLYFAGETAPRDEARTDTVQDAQCWAGIYDLRLKHDYHMQRVA